MNKKVELLAKYFADLSKIFISAVVIKQFAEKDVNLAEVVIGFLFALITILIACMLQPKEFGNSE